MKLDEAKQKFIQSWGVLGANWGINRTMAQIHALLLVSPKALSAEEVMNALQISRGNANMNLRTLMEWGIVRKELHPGERKEFFYSEKDIWETARLIAKERKKKELEPILQILQEVSDVKDDGSEDAKIFKKVTSEMHEFASTSYNFLEKFVNSDKSWFSRLLMKIIK